MTKADVRDQSALIFRGRALFDGEGALIDEAPKGFWFGLREHRDRIVHTVRHASTHHEHLSTTLYHWLEGRLWTQDVHLVGRRGEVDVQFRAPLPALGPARDEPLIESVMAHAADVLLMTEASPLSMPGPRIVFANAAFTRMTGYEVDEVIGQTPRLLQGDGTEPEVLEYMRTQLENWTDFEAEVTNYRKDGTPFVVHLDVRAVRDATGWVTHWVSTQRDVTPQRLSRAGLPKPEPRATDDLSSIGQGLNDAHTTILGNVEVAREAAPPGLQPLLEDIESAVVHAHQLTLRLFKRLGDTGDQPREESSVLSLLWVDDDPMVRTVARRIGAARGWDVQVAADAAEALSEAGQRSFDLMILDQSTDEALDGVALREQLRAMGVSSPILLAVSGTGAEPLGPDTISKPFRLSELDERVRRLLSHD